MKKLIALIFLFVSFSASAAPVTWTLNDVVLEECSYYSPGYCDYSGTITGSFVYDADTNTYSDISLTTTMGVLGPGWGPTTYTGQNDWEILGIPWFEEHAVSSVSASGVKLAGIAWDGYCPDGPCQNVLTLAYASSLTNAGGTVAIQVGGASQETLIVGSAGPIAVYRYIHSGTITGVSVVPLPAAVWLFASALAALGISRRGAIAP